LSFDIRTRILGMERVADELETHLLV